MRRTVSYCAIVLCLLAAGALWAQEIDLKEAPACKYCSMNRETFDYSRMLIEYSDGTKVGLCSLHCAAVDLASNPARKLKAISVADYHSKKLIDARRAVWVIGGKKEGIMSRRAKWAFGTKAAARTFIRQNGGSLAGFDGAMKAAYQDMYEDTKMIWTRMAKTGG